jgi:hypothetical protein
VNIITALTPGSCVGETTKIGDTVCSPIVLEVFCPGCGLTTGLKLPPQSMAARVR